jgi:cob(I)alamin adenosyltransferase
VLHPMTRIYTRTGDRGKTGLFDGSRVDKDDLRVEAYGTVDELCSVLSLARLSVDDATLQTEIREVQRFLFIVGADLATPTGEKKSDPVRRVTQEDVEGLEHLIDKYWERLDPMQQFIVPGETLAAAHLHVARTVCRRAERLVVQLNREAPVTESVIRYLNRLSDLLFAWGRYADQGKAEADPITDLKKP